MITQQLIEYVRQRVSAGVLRENITKELLGVGWSADDLNKVFASPEVTAKENIISEVPEIKVQSEAQTSNPMLSFHEEDVNSEQRVVSPVIQSLISQQDGNSLTQPSSQNPHPSKDSIWYRPVIIISVLFILLGVVTGGVYAYYVSTKQLSGITIMRGAIENKVAIKSVGFTATSTSITTVNIGSTPIGAQASSVLGNAKFIYATTTINQNGTIALGKQGAHTEFDITVALHGSVSVATTSGTYSMALRTIFSREALDMKLLHANVSIKSTNPQLSMGPYFVNTALATVLNKWVRFVNFASASSSPQFTGISLSSMATSSPAVTRDLKALRTYAYGFQYVRSIRNLGIEYLDGVPAYHISLIIQNTPESILLMQRLAYDYLQSLSANGKIQTMSFASFLQKAKVFDKTLTQKIPIDIWIGEKDSRVYKLIISNLNITLPGNNSMILREEVHFVNYNTIANIIPPKNSESMQSFIKGIFSPNTSSSSKSYSGNGL